MRCACTFQGFMKGVNEGDTSNNHYDTALLASQVLLLLCFYFFILVCNKVFVLKIKLFIFLLKRSHTEVCNLVHHLIIDHIMLLFITIHPSKYFPLNYWLSAKHWHKILKHKLINSSFIRHFPLFPQFQHKTILGHQWSLPLRWYLCHSTKSLVRYMWGAINDSSTQEVANDDNPFTGPHLWNWSV